MQAALFQPFSCKAFAKQSHHLLNRRKWKKGGSFEQNPPILSKTQCKYRACVGSWQLNEFSQLQIMYDNINLLWSGSCRVHSSESYQATDCKLSPLSAPTLLYRDEGESSKVFATDVSSWKIISPIFTAIEEQTDVFHTFLRHWEEWEMSREELEMGLCFSLHLDIHVRQDCCLTRILKCLPQAAYTLMHRLYQRLRMRVLFL